MKAFTLAAAAVVALASAPVHAAPADADFLTMAMQGDNAEVAMGHLAETQGGSAKVRRYGHMLVVDHGAHRAMLGTLAQSMGLSPSDAIPDAARQDETMLQGLHGAAFDSAFRNHMVMGHEKNITLYQDEAKSAQSPKVRHMAIQTLPTLRKHLAAAKAL